MHVSTSLAIAALKDVKIFNMLMMFVNLKLLSKDGKLKLPANLGRGEKRIYKILIDQNWCSEDGVNCFVRSFDRIRRTLKLKRGIGLRLNQSDVISKSAFKAFLVGCAMFSVVRSQKHRKKRLPARLTWKGNTTGPSLPALDYDNPISIRYFAAYMRISIGKAHSLKKLALRFKKIKVIPKPREFEFYVGNKLISPIEKELQPVLLDFPEWKGRIFIKRGELFYRQPDQIIPLVTY
jgi:hypothetical protein